ncbi:hypothetical protein PR048_013885 [Dryococelus australis]|uniref:Uncharacterized protein n=1 Tax=Dryococelus australis TaxID=614101 RepID=A0ABQ9HTG9_9NEOP|nr:hypothetical protein PR048_013885 [Dryococelus australis]
MAKQCTFNKQWLDFKLNPEFARWLDLVPENSSLPYCKVCLKSFNISNMGRQSVLSHANGPKHIKNAQSTCLQPTISLFAKSTRSEQCANEDKVTSAEIMWALEIVAVKMSLNSCDKSAFLFGRMFHYSKIAQSF